MSQEQVQQVAETATAHVNCCLRELRSLFLVHDMIDTAKFAVSLWFLTYIGGWFNAMTLIILSWVGLFTVPKVNTLNNYLIVYQSSSDSAFGA